MLSKIEKKLMCSPLKSLSKPLTDVRQGQAAPVRLSTVFLFLWGCLQTEGRRAAARVTQRARTPDPFLSVQLCC